MTNGRPLHNPLSPRNRAGVRATRNPLSLRERVGARDTQERPLRAAGIIDA